MDIEEYLSNASYAITVTPLGDESNILWVRFFNKPVSLIKLMTLLKPIQEDMGKVLDLNEISVQIINMEYISDGDVEIFGLLLTEQPSLMCPLE